MPKLPQKRVKNNVVSTSDAALQRMKNNVLTYGLQLLRYAVILSPEERTLFSFNDFVFQAPLSCRGGKKRTISGEIDAMHHIDSACTAIAFFYENAIRWRSN